MKKICILSSANIKHMTLISLYTEQLNKKDISYDIIYMDKYGEDEYFESEKKYRYENVINKNDNKFKKIFKYLKFIKYATNIIEKNDYDFIIVWNEITAIMFNNYLSKKWKKKYCLNYRDYCYQDYPIISEINKRVIYNSSFTTISSDKFENFLPNYDYIHIHSLNSSILSKIIPRSSFCLENEKIKLTFIGNIRFLEQNKKILNVFKNDKRFEIHFYGTNAEVLKEYAEKNNISNCFFKTSFSVEETNIYIEKMDLVNNLYGNNNRSLDFALSIKLYYGVYYRVPILVNANTYMADKINEYNIGYVVDEINEQLPNSIFKWYKNFDFDVFNKGCEKFILKINSDNKKFNEKIEGFIL